MGAQPWVVFHHAAVCFPAPQSQYEQNKTAMVEKMRTIEEEKDQLTKQVPFMRSFYSAAEFPIKT